MTETTNNEKPTETAGPVEELVMCKFLGTEDEEFRAFIKQMPDKHWAKYDLSAVRLGWEAHKRLGDREQEEMRHASLLPALAETE